MWKLKNYIFVFTSVVRFQSEWLRRLWQKNFRADILGWKKEVAQKHSIESPAENKSYPQIYTWIYQVDFTDSLDEAILHTHPIDSYLVALSFETPSTLWIFAPCNKWLALIFHKDSRSYYKIKNFFISK